MPKIEITEQDLTSPGVVNESTDVVYIPGFVNLDETINADLYVNGEYQGLDLNEPTFFDSISEFEARCGKEPAYFAEKQMYTDLVSVQADGSTSGFPDDAVPYDRIMFEKGDADPAYIMAKEILAAGLPIIYQRVNPKDSITYYQGADQKPSDWDENYSDYQIGSVAYAELEAATPPTMFTVANGKTLNSALTYFTRSAELVDGKPTGTLIFTSVDIESIPTDTSTDAQGNITETIKDYIKDTIPYYYTLDAQVTYLDSDETATEDDMYPYNLMTEVDFTTLPILPSYSASDTYYTLNPSGGYDKVVSAEAPVDWGTNEANYFTIVATDVTTIDVAYVSGQFYKKVGDNYEIVNDQSAPSDWTTENTYFQLTITEVEFSREYKVDNDYLRYNSEEKIYEPITSADAPIDWGTQGLFFTKEQIVTDPKFTTSIIFEQNPDTGLQEAIYKVPAKWINNCLTSGAVATISYSAVTATEDGAVPEWNPSAQYKKESSAITIKTMYDALDSIYAINDTGLSDKGNYSIKYLTSGGYPTYEYSGNTLVTKMLELCKNRGDCVAFIDHTNNPQRNNNIDQRGSLYYAVTHDLTFNTDGEYAAMFTPWATYNRISSDISVNSNDEARARIKSQIKMPGSFAYFLSLADSIVNAGNANWLAIAGVARGLVQNLASNGISVNIPNGAADKMSPRDNIAINPITNIKPYGYTIWGNRTLKKNTTNLTATSFLNVRNLVSDVKKEVYRTARKLTFEQNSDVLWVNFKAEISPLLDRMLHGYGVSAYRLLLDTNHPRFNERATLCVKIMLSPIESVEDFYVSIILTDDAEAEITE